MRDFLWLLKFKQVIEIPFREGKKEKERISHRERAKIKHAPQKKEAITIIQ